MNIFYIRETPIDVDKQMYEAFCQMGKHRLTVIAKREFPPHRKQCGFSDKSVFFTTLYSDDYNYYVELFNSNKDALFIFNGIGMAKPYISVLKKNRNKFAFIAERDNTVFFPRWKRLLKNYFPILNYINNIYLVKNCQFFLAMGSVGVNSYLNYHVNEAKLYNYMYCSGEETYDPREYSFDSPVKFIYIGRFDYRIKGVDVLLEAFDGVEGNYSLTMVGGYGDNYEDVMRRITSNSRINYIGTWKSDCICKLLNAYDVIIVPSKADGWNLHNNYSIQSGVASITTDDAGSDDLVRNCKNGFVVKSKSSSALQAAIYEIINNPSSVNVLKNKTVSYREYINPQRVALYLQDVIEYSILNGKRIKPTAPWLLDESADYGKEQKNEE